MDTEKAKIPTEEELKKFGIDILFQKVIIKENKKDLDLSQYLVSEKIHLDTKKYYIKFPIKGKDGKVIKIIKLWLHKDFKKNIYDPIEGKIGHLSQINFTEFKFNKNIRSEKIKEIFYISDESKHLNREEIMWSSLRFAMRQCKKNDGHLVVTSDHSTILCSFLDEAGIIYLIDVRYDEMHNEFDLYCQKKDILFLNKDQILIRK